MRTATRKRKIHELQSSSEGSLDQYLAAPNKRPRKAGTVHSARFSFSGEERAAQSSQDEIADSLEEDTPVHPRPESIQVVIPYNVDFNREAYVKAPASSQSSSQASNPVHATPLRYPGLFIYEKGTVIPDSQEVSESSTSQLSKSATVSLAFNLSNTSASRASNSEVFDASAQEANYPGNLNSFRTASWRSEERLEPESYQNPSTCSGEAQRLDQVEQSRPSSQHSLTAAHPASDDLQFQTQVPFLSESIISAQNTPEGVRKDFEATAEGHRLESCSPLLTETFHETSTLGQARKEVLLRQVHQDKSSSSSDEPWQGAQIVLPLDASASQIESGESDRQIIHSPCSDLGHPSTISQEENLVRPNAGSVLNQRDQHSLTSPSHDQSQHQVTVSSSEIIIASIEREDIRQDLNSDPGSSSHLLSSRLKFPDTYEGHYPERPQTPSEFNMDDEDHLAPPSSLSFKEAIQRRREEARAKLSADGSSRSPSEIPPRRPSPPPSSSINQMIPPAPILPIRDHSLDQLMASVEDPQVSGENSPPPRESLASLHLPAQKSADRIVSLPIISIVRDVYGAALRNNKQDIKALILDHRLDPAGVQRIDAMVEQLQLITDHQDLIADVTSTQAALSDEHQSKWAETSSSKCLFIREFLDALRLQEKHVAVLARPGRMLDILEALLRANRYIYVRPDTSTSSGQDVAGALKVTLLPTGLDGSRYIVARADVVIAFDESFRAGEQYSQILRADITEPQKLSLLISLVVTNSAEHIELCLPKDMSPFKRKRSLVGYIWQKRHDVGKLDNYPPPDQAALAIAQYLIMNSIQETPWPLPENPDIEGIRPSSDEPTDPPSGSTTQSRDENQFEPPVLPSSIKRTLDEEDVDSTKRMRMTPSSGDVAFSGDLARVNDRLGNLSQVKLPTNQDVRETIEQVKQLDDTQSDQTTSLLAKVSFPKPHVYLC